MVQICRKLRLGLIWSALVAPLSLVSCGDEAGAPPPWSEPSVLASGVVVRDAELGSGEPLIDGEWFAIHYDCRIAAIGTEPGPPLPYDSTRRGEPFVARIGGNHLLPGFADGVRGMRVGGHRQIVVPPAQAHGARGRGQVPPDATLEYELWMVARFERHANGSWQRVLVAGSGTPPRAGDQVTIDQRSWTFEGQRLLTDSREAGELSFVLGRGAALPGLEAALLEMSPRERRQLVLPAELAYGPLGVGIELLPGQELLMEVELTRIAPR